MAIFGSERRYTDVELRQISENAVVRVARRSSERRKLINSIVWAYIKTNDRIVYGGAALNALVQALDPSDALYDDRDVGDVEFYSDTPGSDVVELCDIMHREHGMQDVQGREAVHAGTLTVSVDFQRCFDITFMPNHVMCNLPILRDPTGVRCAHPHVMAMDLLRMMTEPDTSFWRLDKAVPRFCLIEKHFPLRWDQTPLPPLKQLETQVAPTDAWWHCMETCVEVGACAADKFELSIGMQHVCDLGHKTRCLQLVSTSFDVDIAVARALASEHTHACVELCHEPFGDLLGRSVRFMNADRQCVMEIIDAYPRCVPMSSDHRSRCASFLYCLAVAMACHLRAFVNRDQVTLSLQSEICERLLRVRVVGNTNDAKDAKDAKDANDFNLERIKGVTTSAMKIQALAHSLPSTRGEGHRSIGKRREHQKSARATTMQPWLRYNPSEATDEERTRVTSRMASAKFLSRSGRVVESRQLRMTATATADN